MRPRVYLETFGCQMNVLDSELVLSQLRARGYEEALERDSADVILYNTCSVREHAEQKVFSRLGELRARKKRQPGLVIGVIGCLAERDGANIFKKYPHVDLLCGPGELDRLAGMVHNAVTTGGSIVGAADGGGGAAREPLTKRARQVALMGANTRRSSTAAAAEDRLELLDLSRSVSPADDVAQAYVRITRGCNKFCTYCVVPYTRGAEVHRPPGKIIDEVRRLADAGVQEVTLLGQTINHYRFAHGDGRVTSFAELLHDVHEAVPHLPRLRFVTSFPRDFGDDALAVMRDCGRICRYLHAPAQSGSDAVLRRMNRGYAAAEYEEFVARARAHMSDVSIVSDFIVGFPGESDEDFAKTVELVRRCRFKSSFVFKYSPRPGTVAINRFEDDVPEEIKRRRNNELLAVQQELTKEHNRAMIGREVEVLVEGESKFVSRSAYPASRGARGVGASGVELGWERRNSKGGSAATATLEPAAAVEVRTQLVGRTRGDEIVCFEGAASLKGKILGVRIGDARGMTLFGERV
jgi:tRNA-2-methylthio-N6-dimethylallyladenosine synthase